MHLTRDNLSGLYTTQADNDFLKGSQNWRLGTRFFLKKGAVTVVSNETSSETGWEDMTAFQAVVERLSVVDSVMTMDTEEVHVALLS